MRIRELVGLIVVSAAPVLAQSNLATTIEAMERKELNCLRTGNMAEFASLIAEDAIFLDARGSAGKAEVVRNSSEVRLQDFTMEDVHFLPLTPKSGILIYRLIESGTSHGRGFSARVNVSAVWVEREGTWLCVFSQETPARAPAEKTAAQN